MSSSDSIVPLARMAEGLPQTHSRVLKRTHLEAVHVRHLYKADMLDRSRHVKESESKIYNQIVCGFHSTVAGSERGAATSLKPRSRLGEVQGCRQPRAAVPLWFCRPTGARALLEHGRRARQGSLVGFSGFSLFQSFGGRRGSPYKALGCLEPCLGWWVLCLIETPCRNYLKQQLEAVEEQEVKLLDRRAPPGCFFCGISQGLF